MSDISDDKNYSSFDILPALIWVSNHDGQCQYVNKAWQEFTGQTLESALGKGWLESVHAEDVELFSKNPLQMEREFRLRKANGKYAWVVDKATKQASVIIGVITDISARITQQKIAEESLDRSKEFFKNILESIPDPIFVKDEKHRWIEGNKAFFDMFGAPKEAVLGKSDYDFFNKDEADVFWKKDNEVFSSEGVIDNFETFTQMGFTRTFFTRKVMVKNPDGKKILIGAIRDITELERIKHHLEQVIEDLTESNEELERFAYIASHDLQEPLRMVCNFTQLLKERYSDKLDDDAQRYIAFATDAATRMAEMVDDLLEYARLNVDPTHQEQVDCNALLKYVEKNLHESIKDAGAQIEIGNLPTLNQINPVRLSRVFQNIISNAIKYRKKDTAPIIKVSAKELKKSWQFNIADNGIGIDSVYYDRIFMPFKRLHTREEYSGTGIGLAVCKKIVNNFGGQISVKSTIGEGSILTFTIPKERK